MGDRCSGWGGYLYSSFMYLLTSRNNEPTSSKRLLMLPQDYHVFYYLREKDYIDGALLSVSSSLIRWSYPNV